MLTKAVSVALFLLAVALTVVAAFKLGLSPNAAFLERAGIYLVGGILVIALLSLVTQGLVALIVYALLVLAAALLTFLYWDVSVWIAVKATRGKPAGLLSAEVIDLLSIGD